MGDLVRIRRTAIHHRAIQANAVGVAPAVIPQDPVGGGSTGASHPQPKPKGRLLSYAATQTQRDQAERDDGPSLESVLETIAVAKRYGQQCDGRSYFRLNPGGPSRWSKPQKIEKSLPISHFLRFSRCSE
jgi:hypothetical protein